MVDKSNYVDFLRQLLKTNDASVVFNSAFVQASSLPPAMRKRIWRYRKGQLVLVPRELDLNLSKKEREGLKTSVYGAWSPNLYKVERLLLQRTKTNHLVPSYRLNVKHKDDIVFYNTDVIPALFAHDKAKKSNASR